MTLCVACCVVNRIWTLYLFRRRACQAQTIQRFWSGRGEKGEKIEGHKGRFVQVTNSSQVDSRGKALRRHFRKWLLDQYKHLVANGDIVPVKGEAEQVKYMRKLFDRANGEIRNIVIEKHDDGSKVRPGDQAGWKKLWKSADHLNIWEKAAQAK